MKKAQLVVRQNIINPRTGKMWKDDGLYVLDGIRYGQEKQYDDNTNEIDILEELMIIFEAENPDFSTSIAICSLKINGRELMNHD